MKGNKCLPKTEIYYLFINNIEDGRYIDIS
jgi:hypothetical protein